MSMTISIENIATINQAQANGNRTQLVVRRDDTITAHEHVGQSWTQPDDGSLSIGWVPSNATGAHVAQWVATLAVNPLDADPVIDWTDELAEFAYEVSA